MHHGTRGSFNMAAAEWSKIDISSGKHTTFESEYVWRQALEGSLFFSHGTSNSKGTCILIHKSLPYTVHKSMLDNDDVTMGCHHGHLSLAGRMHKMISEGVWPAWWMHLFT